MPPGGLLALLRLLGYQALADSAPQGALPVRVTHGCGSCTYVGIQAAGVWKGRAWDTSRPMPGCTVQLRTPHSGKHSTVPGPIDIFDHLQTCSSAVQLCYMHV